jgi:anthranilate phosphoribosyltransferase
VSLSEPNSEANDNLRMAIDIYLREIGRGKIGAKNLSRDDATDLMGQILDGLVNDLEIGAFCMAMRVKGETPTELFGFLDAIQMRLHRIQCLDATTIILPSYNGARKRPLLTPLLALLLAKEGFAVLVHGCNTEDSRVHSAMIFHEFGIQAAATAPKNILAGTVQFVATEQLLAGLYKLLAVRRVLGVRNSAHSLVKLMNPCQSNSVLVTSYTHQEYAISMQATLQLTGTCALLLRGTEGEAVADPRRTPQMFGLRNGLVSSTRSSSFY